MKKFWKKYQGAIIVVVLLALFGTLILLTGGGKLKTGKDDIDISKLSEEGKAWVDATETDEYVVTVLAQTTCSHCIAFKPVIEGLKEKYNFNLYWWEVNELYESNETDYKAVTEYYNLKSYNGTPHTFITKNGELIAEQGGEMDEESLLNFLKEKNVISE